MIKHLLRPARTVVALLIILSCSEATWAAADGVPRADCFPVERLPQARRAEAEELYLKILDSEALYTLVGGLKPMSSGFLTIRFAERPPRVMATDEKGRARQTALLEERRAALAKAEQAREVLSAFRCGELYADVHHFGKVFDGHRSLEAVVFNLPLLRDVLARRANLFERWGLTPSSHPMEVLMAVEYEQSSARNGGYGFLFGYPENAVRFFVESVDHEEWTGEFVERDFYSVPTFSRPTNGFVWAVPKGYAESENDRNIKTRALAVLEEYRARRARYIGEGKPGVVALLRDWFDNGNGQYSPRFAKVRSQVASRTGVVFRIGRGATVTRGR